MKRALLLIPLLLLTTTVMAKDAGDLSEGQALFSQGSFEGAAKFFSAYINAHPEKTTPEALLLLGRSLDKMGDQVNNAAEQTCYRAKGAPRTPQCMHSYAAKMNADYGAGSFKFFDTLIIIRTMGVQYQQILDKFPGSPQAAEAAYYLLEKNLIGNPDEVLGRVQAYIAQYPKGEWNAKARLLYARLNEDLWWIHRKWAWLLYNNTVAEDELVIKGEKYRQAALKAYEDVMKKSGPESKIAKQEYDLLKSGKEDGKLYGIVSDAATSGEAGVQRK